MDKPRFSSLLIIYTAGYFINTYCVSRIPGVTWINWTFLMFELTVLGTQGRREILQIDNKMNYSFGIYLGKKGTKEGDRNDRVRKNLILVHLLFIKQLKMKMLFEIFLQCLPILLVGSFIENYTSCRSSDSR